MFDWTKYYFSVHVSSVVHQVVKLVFVFWARDHCRWKRHCARGVYVMVKPSLEKVNLVFVYIRVVRVCMCVCVHTYI